jgi:hypothetical protein
MRNMLERLRQNGAAFEEVENEILSTLWDLDVRLQTGRIPMETYRNDKGNWWMNLVSQAIANASGVEVKPDSIPGASETHNVDLAFTSKLGPIVCVEVKAQGNPGYVLRGEKKPERRMQSDIDKRLKEVKYTSMDLKRRYDRGGIGSSLSLDKEQDWLEWKQKALPKFYTLWLGRKVAGESEELLLKKFRETMKYLNGIGALIYEQKGSGYREIEVFGREFPISQTIHNIVADIRSSHQPLQSQLRE